jgi:prepilin-type processing-associated H-X9-DG protein
MELLVTIAIIALLIGVLVPSLAGARKLSQTAACLSNLQQMTVAAATYTNDNADSYPSAQFTIPSTGTSMCWDFSTTAGQPTQLGLLWGNAGTEKIQQCPAFSGKANWTQNPYTGYNYNTSYLGHGQGESIPAPATASQVNTPTNTVIFGDGQYSAGADKFMRAPLPNPGDQGFSARYSGTQGYRHQGSTNIAHCDGHAESVNTCFTSYQNSSGNSVGTGVAPGTGFLSVDNSAYNLN